MFYCIKMFSIANFDLPIIQRLAIKGVLSCFHDDPAFVTQKEKKSPFINSNCWLCNGNCDANYYERKDIHYCNCLDEWWKLLLNKSEGKLREFYLAIFNLNKCNFKIWETKNPTIKFQQHKLFCQVISGTDNLTVFCKCWHDTYILKWFYSAGSRLIQTLFSPQKCHLRETVY